MLECRLIDGVQRNKEYPETFLIPIDRQKNLVECGDYVKIGLEDANPKTPTTEYEIQSERFWVKITEIRIVSGVKVYTGSVENDLVKYGKLYPHKAPIVFFNENILSIHG